MAHNNKIPPKTSASQYLHNLFASNQSDSDDLNSCENKKTWFSGESVEKRSKMLPLREEELCWYTDTVESVAPQHPKDPWFTDDIWGDDIDLPFLDDLLNKEISDQKSFMPSSSHTHSPKIQRTSSFPPEVKPCGSFTRQYSNTKRRIPSHELPGPSVPVTVSSQVHSVEWLRSQLEKVNKEYSSLKESTSVKDGETSILQQKLNAALSTMEKQRLDKEKELGSLKLNFVTKIKELERSLECTKTQAMFKEKEAESNLERCRELKKMYARDSNLGTLEVSTGACFRKFSKSIGRPGEIGSQHIEIPEKLDSIMLDCQFTRKDLNFGKELETWVSPCIFSASKPEFNFVIPPIVDYYPFNILYRDLGEIPLDNYKGKQPKLKDIWMLGRKNVGEDLNIDDSGGQDDGSQNEDQPCQLFLGNSRYFTSLDKILISICNLFRLPNWFGSKCVTEVLFHVTRMVREVYVATCDPKLIRAALSHLNDRDNEVIDACLNSNELDHEFNLFSKEAWNEKEIYVDLRRGVALIAVMCSADPDLANAILHGESDVQRIRKVQNVSLTDQSSHLPKQGKSTASRQASSNIFARPSGSSEFLQSTDSVSPPAQCLNEALKKRGHCSSMEVTNMNGHSENYLLTFSESDKSENSSSWKSFICEQSKNLEDIISSGLRPAESIRLGLTVRDNISAEYSLLKLAHKNLQQMKKNEETEPRKKNKNTTSSESDSSTQAEIPTDEHSLLKLASEQPQQNKGIWEEAEQEKKNKKTTSSESDSWTQDELSTDEHSLLKLASELVQQINRNDEAEQRKKDKMSTEEECLLKMDCEDSQQNKGIREEAEQEKKNKKNTSSESDSSTQNPALNTKKEVPFGISKTHKRKSDDINLSSSKKPALTYENQPSCSYKTKDSSSSESSKKYLFSVKHDVAPLKKPLKGETPGKSKELEMEMVDDLVKMMNQWHSRPIQVKTNPSKIETMEVEAQPMVEQSACEDEKISMLEETKKFKKKTLNAGLLELLYELIKTIGKLRYTVNFNPLFVSIMYLIQSFLKHESNASALRLGRVVSIIREILYCRPSPLVISYINRLFVRNISMPGFFQRMCHNSCPTTFVIQAEAYFERGSCLLEVLCIQTDLSLRNDNWEIPFLMSKWLTYVFLVEKTTIMLWYRQQKTPSRRCHCIRSLSNLLIIMYYRAANHYSGTSLEDKLNARTEQQLNDILENGVQILNQMYKHDFYFFQNISSRYGMFYRLLETLEYLHSRKDRFNSLNLSESHMRTVSYLLNEGQNKNKYRPPKVKYPNELDEVSKLFKSKIQFENVKEM